MDGIVVNNHSSIRIERDGKVVYFDPYNIDQNYEDADVIFITHGHFDHLSEMDIEKIVNSNTTFVVNELVFERLKTSSCYLNEDGFNCKYLVVEPGKTYEVSGIKFETVAMYNINKAFHPKEDDGVGFIIEMGGQRIYVAGDTDITPENKKVKCDIALLPVGGTYTMDYKEAAELANIIKPKYAIPTHYGRVAGDSADGQKFVSLLDPGIESKVFMK